MREMSDGRNEYAMRVNELRVGPVLTDGNPAATDEINPANLTPLSREEPLEYHENRTNEPKKEQVAGNA
jgi:hypothetical protein